MKNDIVLINFIVLGGSGGMLPQENFLMFQPLRLFLAASEHLDGESLSVISTGSPTMVATLKGGQPASKGG